MATAALLDLSGKYAIERGVDYELEVELFDPLGDGTQGPASDISGYTTWEMELRDAPEGGVQATGTVTNVNNSPAKIRIQIGGTETRLMLKDGAYDVRGRKNDQTSALFLRGSFSLVQNVTQTSGTP